MRPARHPLHGLRHVPLFTLLFGVSLTACKEGDRSGVADKDGPEQIGQAEKARLLLTTHPWVARKEFNCISNDFKERFLMVEGPDTNAFADRTDTLLWAELDSLMATITPKPTDKHIRGLAFHYGLDTTVAPNRLKLALECVELTPLGDGVAYARKDHDPALFFAVQDGGLHMATKAGWLTAYQTPYLQRTVVKRNSDSPAPTPVIPGVDHTSFVLRWEGTLDSLAAAHDPELQHLIIAHVSEPMVRNGSLEQGFRHNLAVHGMDKNGKTLLDDSTYVGSSFRNKAADLGSACPPDCATPLFYRIGLRARANCL